MNSYNERTHIIGRFWIITALFAFLMIPVAISLKLNAFPQASVVLKGLAPIAMLFYPTAVIEVCTYSPMLGSGATYIAFVTGNINNLKLPCALSAMDSAGSKPKQRRGRNSFHNRRCGVINSYNAYYCRGRYCICSVFTAHNGFRLRACACIQAGCARPFRRAWYVLHRKAL